MQTIKTSQPRKVIDLRKGTEELMEETKSPLNTSLKDLNVLWMKYGSQRLQWQSRSKDGNYYDVGPSHLLGNICEFLNWVIK